VFDGASIGQYRVLHKIGEGGMGAVFLAEHTLIGRRAAIKVLLPELSVRREIVDRFFNEARATSAVSDPGIVQVFDFGFHTDNSAYIVMEFLEGEPLDLRLKRLGVVPIADGLRITRQVAGSLAAAHARGIVHRDLKPDNIFMVRDPEAPAGERPKILDFGIAKLSGDDPNRMRTRTGALMGTPIYMSPEQCRGAGGLDHRSDIYSLGCVLYHLITGRPPFDYQGMGEILAAHLREPAAPPSALVSGVPPGIDELVLRCLAKSPDERFQSMLELSAACEALLARITASGPSTPTVALATPLAPGFRSVLPGTSSTSIPGTLPPTTLTAAASAHTTPPSARRTGVWIGFGIALVGGIAAIVVATRSSPEPAPPPTPTPASTPTPAPTPAATTPPVAAPTQPPPQPAPTLAVEPQLDAGVALPDAAIAAKPAAKPVKVKTSAKPKPEENLYDDR